MSLNAYEHLNSSPVIEGGGKYRELFFSSGSRAKISVFLKYHTRKKEKADAYCYLNKVKELGTGDQRVEWCIYTSL